MRALPGRILVAVMVAVMPAACGDGQGGDGGEEAMIYSAAIRFVMEEATEGKRPERPVFVVGVEEGIPLKVQVGVVQRLEEFADVRFVDDRSEAIVEEEPRRPVRQQGMLLILGPIERDGKGRAELRAERYERADDVTVYQVVATQTDGRWQVEKGLDGSKVAE